MQPERDVIIQTVADSGSAFGVTCENTPQGVFIPQQLIRGHDLHMWDAIRTLIAPNNREPERIPWMAIKLIGKINAGKPMSGDAFMTALVAATATNNAIAESVVAWVEGDFDKALKILKQEQRA